MVQPMRPAPTYYARFARGLSPAARATWDALPAEGNRHWVFDQAWQGRRVDDPALALLVAELQNALIETLTRPWRWRRRRILLDSFDANLAVATGLV